MVAVKVTVTCQTRLQAFGLHARADASPNNVRFALYRDNGGTPVGGALVAATALTPMPSGDGNAEAAPSPSNPTIAAGDYWVVSNFDVTALTYWDSGTGLAYFVGLSYTAGFPATFPAGASTVPNAYSYYIDVIDSPS
jgi:hypothetical protein